VEAKFKFVDRVVGTFLCWLVAGWRRVRRFVALRNPATLDCQAQQEILIIKLCCLGDAVLSLPTLRNLKANLPRSSISVLTTSRTSGLFTQVKYVDEVLQFPITYNLVAYLRLLLLLRRRRFSIALTLDPWYRITALLCVWTRPRMSAGFFFQGMPLLKHILDKHVEYTEKKHTVQTYLDLVRGIGLTIEDSHLEFPLGADDRSFAEGFLAAHGLAGPVIGIFPAASARWVSKRWPAANYAQLADRLVEETGAHILFLTGRGQSDVSTSMVSKMRNKATVAPDSLSVFEMAALLARCHMVISSDSSPMHLAAAVGAPVVALFSNVPPQAYYPFMGAERYRLVRKELACSPCAAFGDMPRCPYQYKCINELPVEQVLRSCRELWNSIGQSSKLESLNRASR
jgi:lipopolysaccharide heptosyltransferase II